MILAVDLSGSMAGYPLKQAKKAMENFVLEMDVSQLKIGIIVFADRVKVLLEPTNHLQTIIKTIHEMRINGRLIGFGNEQHPFGAMYEVFMQYKEEKEEQNQYAVVLTDGVWNGREQAIASASRLKSEGIEIISIGFGCADEGFIKSLASKDRLGMLTETEILPESFSKIAKVMNEKSYSIVEK